MLESSKGNEKQKGKKIKKKRKEKDNIAYSMK
jgi:hypothetical protein